jgi:agmatinase
VTEDTRPVGRDQAYEKSAPPFNFLGLPPEYCDGDASAALVLPIPYEATTTYGGGAKNGPDAIIEASRQVELYDIELRCEPAVAWGVHTLPALSPSLSSPESAVADIANAVEAVARSGKLLVGLGGEHTVSVGVARGLARVYPDFVTVQLDAHADLRDTYEGTGYSHACAARRISEIGGGAILQLGIRSLDISEAEFLDECDGRVHAVFADNMAASADYLDLVANWVRDRRVYLTIDIDCLDPSLMPATGTPEPGGLGWHQVLDIVRAVVASAESVIAFDCVELAPIPGLHSPDFTAAKLVYKTISLILNASRNPPAS